MTGNVVLLGFGVAGSGGLPVVAPLVSLVSFLVGAGLGGILAKRIGDRHPAHVAGALGLEVSLLGVAALVAGGGWGRPRAPSRGGRVAPPAPALGGRDAPPAPLAVPGRATPGPAP